ncbi:signal peptidase I [Microlunatus speluncae]|uniref:signal peptidase I n=1 Tax=Microlunatus speluncae TaxID=2594267 RepID=UPI0012662370|nr:signal peptidase I [Microlunatus speluncae]
MPTADQTPSSASSSGHRRSRPSRFFTELVIVVVGALIVSSLLRAFVGQMFIIPSGSMENTLQIDDRVAVQKITDFRRGDIVVFEDPGGWLGSAEAADPDPDPFARALEFTGLVPAGSDHLIKRVIGMPGDRVICCDKLGRLTVNGVALDETRYVYASPEDGEPDAPSDLDFEVVVPAGRIFVMGDHRAASADSRCHLSDISVKGPEGSVAFVPIDKVVGPAFAIVMPFNRLSTLQRPPIFDLVPEPTGPPPKEAVIKPKGVTC